MFRHLTIIGAALLLLASACGKEAPAPLKFHSNPSHFVDPFIGTGGHGHTFPGATLPFGMVQLSPDTRLTGWDGCSGYHDSDSVVYGFSHTHLSGTGVSDYGDVLLMPERGTRPTSDNTYDRWYASRFDKGTEVASPGYYSAELIDHDVKVELTATERCGLHRYTFKGKRGRSLVIDLGHRDPVISASLEYVNDTLLRGHRRSNAWARDQQLFFEIHLSRSAPNLRVHNIESMDTNDVMHGKNLVVRLKFSDPDAEQLLVKVGISAVSMEGARQNLLAELPDWDFGATRSKAESAWNKQLNKIVVDGGTDAQKRIFYTALYHTMLAPNLFMDVDQRYRGMDGQVHQAKKGRHYTVFSLWDTFRATHPLYTIIEQDRTNAFIQTFLRQYEDGGILPIWELAGNYTGCMIGYHAIPVIADAYVKGLRDYDTEKALAAMQHSAMQDHLGLEYYRRQGFIGAGDEAESVSKTLEYAYDDWCIATMARAMGRNEVYKTYLQRAQFYKNLFDPAEGFFRAKMNGGWQAPFDPREVNFNFTEANAWQYSLFVPQDIPGLIALYGGPARFEAHLDSLFMGNSQTTGRDQADITGLIGQYAHGNEPSHHMAYLYSYVGASHKTQQRVRQIMDELYTDQPDGLSGNEDCGQMSAWYVMSAMGFYSVTPGDPRYTIGTPLFESAVINLENDKAFVIRAAGAGSDRPYIQTATLNGKPLEQLYIAHADIVAGGELVFEMGAEPRRDWAGPDAAAPDVRIDEQLIAMVPYFEARAQTFTDTLTVAIRTAEKGAAIHYTTDGSEPTSVSPQYAAPIVLDTTQELRAIAVRADGTTSFPTAAHFYRIDGGRSIQLNATYANQYAAGGNDALIDHLRGGPNFRTGRWQGYREDFEGTVDLGELRDLELISASFLQDIGSWIWAPKRVEYAISADGKNFRQVASFEAGVPDDRYEAVLKEYPFALQARARYVRVRAQNYGVCPEWHLGAGGTTWIFMDEIVVE